MTDFIDFILQEHDRQLEICALLEDFLVAPNSEHSSEWAVSVLKFITEDLPVHIEDEEVDLFPMLVSLQAEDQDLATILDQLNLEHEIDRDLAEPLLKGLREVADGEELSDPTRFCMYARTLTEAIRRHINWENRVVLPLARKILSEEDHVLLWNRLSDRRQQGKMSST